MKRASVLHWVLLASAMLVGCDGIENPPVTLAERVAGTWQLARVQDSATRVTTEFLEIVGTVELELESVGCCAGRAGYRLTVTRPNGEVIETRETYLPNDNPNDGDDFILLESSVGPLGLTLAYDFNRSFTEMTLTELGAVEDAVESLTRLGIGFPFRAEIILVFDKVD